MVDRLADFPIGEGLRETMVQHAADLFGRRADLRTGARTMAVTTVDVVHAEIVGYFDGLTMVFGHDRVRAISNLAWVRHCERKEG